MTVLTYTVLAAAAVWFVVASFRLLQLVWVKGAEGEEVDAADALKVYLSPLRKPGNWFLDKLGNLFALVLEPKKKA